MTTPAVERRAAPSTVDEALAVLRRSGGRITPAKQALIRFFFTSDELLTAEQIGARHPEFDNSTIYRCVAQFEELGFIEHVHAGHGAAVYRRAGAPTVPVVCANCGRTEQVPQSLLSRVAASIERRTGIEVDVVHFPLSGRCAACRAAD